MTAPSAEVRYLGVDLAWSATARSGCLRAGRGWPSPRGCRACPGGARRLGSPVARGPQRARHRRSARGPVRLQGTPAGWRFELHRRYGARHAGPFPGGAMSTAMRGRDRSPAAALIDVVGGYGVDPLEVSSPHRAIEVFPAPTWIEVFGLSERIRYKHGRLEQRVVALGEARRPARNADQRRSAARACLGWGAPGPSGIGPHGARLEGRRGHPRCSALCVCCPAVGVARPTRTGS